MNSELTRSELLRLLAIIDPILNKRLRENNLCIEYDVKPSQEELNFATELAREYGLPVETVLPSHAVRFNESKLYSAILTKLRAQIAEPGRLP